MHPHPSVGHHHGAPWEVALVAAHKGALVDSCRVPRKSRPTESAPATTLLVDHPTGMINVVRCARDLARRDATERLCVWTRSRYHTT